LLPTPPAKENIDKISGYKVWPRCIAARGVVENRPAAYEEH
jgi:hypothetical protein